MSQTMQIALLLFIAVGCGTLGLLEAASFRRRRNAQLRKLKPLFRKDAAEDKGLLNRYNRRLNRSEYGLELQQKLAASNLTIPPLYWLGLQAGIGLLLFLLLSVLLGLGFVYDLLAAYLLMTIGLKQWLKSRRSKLNARVNEQLPEVCRLMASCLRAGLSVPQSIEMVAKEIAPPSGALFRTMTGELKMGMTLEGVIERLNERVSSQDLHLITQTILIQRRVGGNLSEALDHLARTLEERERVNLEIRNQTAESRFIAVTLTAMPAVILIMFNLVFKGFLKPLFTLPGLILAGVIVGLFAGGLLLIRKVTNVRA
ncbi:type II secretion system F family protein [Gorillibacterium sp. sgz500922]|uniref:type II secretion system F family protein n=1 Tax=Gorillibacterium sp. sgz500922 TaxID=3446694 RepID=UPI003F660C87